PQGVRGNRPDLRNLQQRRDFAAQRINRIDRSLRVLARHDILALQLDATARRELQAEMRQSLVPRPGGAQLLGATLWRHVGEGRGDMWGRGWSRVGAGVASKKSDSQATGSPSLARCFNQTWLNRGLCQSVNRLTL